MVETAPAAQYNSLVPGKTQYRPVCRNAMPLWAKEKYIYETQICCCCCYRRCYDDEPCRLRQLRHPLAVLLKCVIGAGHVHRRIPRLARLRLHVLENDRPRLGIDFRDAVLPALDLDDAAPRQRLCRTAQPDRLRLARARLKQRRIHARAQQLFQICGPLLFKEARNIHFAQRRHIGGMIAPGVGISMNALTEKTAQLPKISLDPPKRCIGSNTVECMKSGILYGAAGCIDGLLDRIEEELGETPTFLATGGLSEFIIPHCRHKIVLDNLLLLKGLQLIYQKNVEA